VYNYTLYLQSIAQTPQLSMFRHLQTRGKQIVKHITTLSTTPLPSLQITKQHQNQWFSAASSTTDKDDVDPWQFFDPSPTSSTQQDEWNTTSPTTPNKPLQFAQIKPQQIPSKQLKLLIPVVQHPSVNWLGLIIGKAGATIKTLASRSGCIVTVRGRGSQRDNNHRENDEPMHVHIAGDTEEQVAAAKKMVKAIFEDKIKILHKDPSYKTSLPLPPPPLEQRTLSQLIKDNDIQFAWLLFHDMMEAITQDLLHSKPGMQQLLHLKREEACTVMCKACFSSEEMWERMAKWQETGFKPTVSTMNTYVSMLMIEGNYAEALRMVNEEYQKMNIEPNDVSFRIVTVNEDYLSNQRTYKLDRWHSQCTSTATAAAWHLNKTLITHHLADVQHFTAMLKFGFNSDQQKEMIETTMKQANVQPTLHLFNEYLTILKIEGHDTEAQRVVDEDMMKTMKIEPNDRTFEILKLKEINVSKMRTARLSYYEKHGGDGATATAWELFHTLIKHKLATHYQFSTMMNFCHDSDAMWKIMNVTMPNAGVHPTIEQWMAYSVRLSIEGDTKRKKEVTAIIEEMARTENYAFNDMDTLPIRELRSEKINSLLGLGSDGVVAAEELFLQLHRGHKVEGGADGDVLTEQEHYLNMINYALHKSDTVSTNSLKDESHNLLKALYWYRLGKSKKINQKGNIKSIPSISAIQKIDTRNMSRSIAIMKVTDTLLTLSEKFSIDPNAFVPPEIKIRTLGTVIGGITRILNTSFSPSISAKVDESNKDVLILEQQEVMAWFQSEQAQKWLKGDELKLESFN